MSEEVTMPSLMMMMTLIVSEDSLARDPHTDTQTDSDLVYRKRFQSRKTSKSINDMQADVPTDKKRFICNFQLPVHFKLPNESFPTHESVIVNA